MTVDLATSPLHNQKQITQMTRDPGENDNKLYFSKLKLYASTAAGYFI
jgi:hypothetical protein